MDGASVTCASDATGIARGTSTDRSGYYAFPLLPPGTYRIVVAKPDYQSREMYDVEVPVASLVEIDLPLRPLAEIWESGALHSVLLPDHRTELPFYGPDVDTSRWVFVAQSRARESTLHATVSDSIRPGLIGDLPLPGRDAFTMLATEPLVTSDASTGRSLGLSAAGQRPSASNFLLDGIEINNALLTGPVLPIAPEAVQEYRISTASYSAEYGHTAGFVANAVTRSGGSAWHGLAYTNWKNDALNAGEFQDNWMGLPRRPLREAQWGYFAGGPLRRNVLYVSSSLDWLRSRARDAPETIEVPSTGQAPGGDFLTSEFFGCAGPSPNRASCRLLKQFAPPAIQHVVDNFLGSLTVQPPVSLDRHLLLERLDYTPGKPGHWRLMTRIADARATRPDFVWSPYAGFNSTLRQPVFAGVSGATWTPRPAWTGELRFGYTSGTTEWNRPHPEVPTLTILGGNGGPREDIRLPGSPVAYEFRNHERTLEWNGNFTWMRGRHIVKFGAGAIRRALDGYLTLGRDGLYTFNTIIGFGLDSPSNLEVGLARDSLSQFQLPDYRRQYRYGFGSLFGEDVIRLTPRFHLDLGLRWEHYGAPRNTGPAPDDAVVLGDGATLGAKLGGAKIERAPTSTVYGSAGVGLAPRVGLAYTPGGRGNTVLRAAYGAYFDSPFANQWLNARSNNVLLANLAYQPGTYLQPLGAILPLYQKQVTGPGLLDAVAFQPRLANGYAQNLLLGAQQSLAGGWSVEVDGVGSLGRRLLTTDLVNRAFSLPAGVSGNRRYAPALGDIAYRGNQGFSDYYAMTAVARRRFSRGYLQAAYTWSHAIDNQSDALAGDYFDLSFLQPAAAPGGTPLSTFSHQFDSRGDRGTADFDQRQNLVFFSRWDLPAAPGRKLVRTLLRDWHFSQLAALRTGFPFTVIGRSPVPDQGGAAFNLAAGVRGAIPVTVTGEQQLTSVPAGSRRILNAAAFCAAPDCPGSVLGRNTLSGPGLYSVDLSLGRSFRVPLGETGRVSIRADAFNALNHANLNQPDPALGDSSTFGTATIGRLGQSTGFPAARPLNESARQVQLLLRIEF